MTVGREGAVCAAFLSLGDTLVADYDVLSLLHQLSECCMHLLAPRAVGLLLADRHDRLIPLATSRGNAAVLELSALQANEGPSLDCFRTGVSVSCAELAAEPRRWPRFAARAERLGFASVHAIPLRLRSETIGAMQLLDTVAGPLPVADLRLAQALADVATIGILQARTIRHGRALAKQLRATLDARVVIDQATGLLAERTQIDTSDALTRLRHYARAHHRPLHEVAHALLTEQLDPIHLAELAHPWN
jgi:hypothetical protein